MPRPRILVVDDEPDIVHACADLLRLRRPHLRVLEAFGLEEALAVERPDVVLTDYRMPGGDGLALAAALAERPDPPACVLMTAYVDAALARRAREAGTLRAFVPKPFLPEQLLEVVDLAADPGEPARARLAAWFAETVDRLGRSHGVPESGL